MRRLLGDVVAGLHAVFEMAVIAGAVLGWWWPHLVPLQWLTAVMLFISLPMIPLRGRCWVTELEKRIRGHWVPSMTRRLGTWATFGLWRPNRHTQWLILLSPLLFWLGRLWREGWPF